MKDWNAILNDLTILCPRRRKRMSSLAAIASYQSEYGISLPKDFCDFAKVFGAGELCGYYRFHVPLAKKDEYDLGTYDSDLKKSSWSEYGIEKERWLFFGATIGGEYFAWNLDEVVSKQESEYKIYHLFRSPNLSHVASTFFEFFGKCRTGKLDSFDDSLKQTYMKY